MTTKTMMDSTKITSAAGSGVTRRELLKLISGGVAAGSVLRPGLAADANGPGKHTKLPGDDNGPTKVWDVSSPQAYSNTVGGALFVNGQIVYASAWVGGSVILQDAQTGAITYQSPRYLELSNAVAVGSKIYFVAGRIGSSPLMCLDLGTKQLNTNVYNTHNMCEISAGGQYLYFIEVKGNNYMACWDTKANAMVWSTNADNSTDAAVCAPLVTGNVIVYGFLDRLMGVDPATGSVLWTSMHPPASNNIYYELAAGDGNVYFAINNTLYAVDLTTGHSAWSWTSPNSLANPVTYNGLVFAGDSAGNLYGIQGGTGGAVAPGKSAWPALPLGGNLTGRFFIEDGIAYCSNGNLIALELTSSEPKVVTYQLSGGVSQINGVENGVAYVAYNNSTRSAAVDIGHQIHEFFCDSQLMADDYVSSQTAAYQPANPRYRTHVRLLDPSSNPRINKSVKVWASDTVTITSLGYLYPIGPATPAWLVTDNAGEIEILSTATDISTPALYLWGTFMDQQEAIVIYPDHHALTTLSGARSSDLSNAKRYDGTDMLDDKSSAGSLASTITSTMGGGVSATIRATSLPYVAFPQSTPNMAYQAKAGSADRAYIRGNVPEWYTVFDSNGNPLYKAGAPPGNVSAVNALDFGAFFQNVARGARKISQMVVNTADAVYHTITDELGTIYRFAVDTIEKAIAVVSSVLKTALKDIVKAVEWLSWLFNWGDILATKDAMKDALSQSAGKLKTWLQAQQSAGLAGLKKNITALAESNGTDSASQRMAGKTFQSQQVQDNDPQTTYGASGAQSYAPSKSLQSKVTGNASQGSLDTTTLLTSTGSDTILSAAQTFIGIVESALANDFKTLLGDIEKLGSDFKLLIADPNDFVKHGIADVIQLAKDVAKTLLDFVNAVIEGFLAFLAQALDSIVALANATIHIPVISELWQLISKNPLTVLDLCALLAAVPVTIIEKAIGGQQVSAAENSSTAPPLNTNIGFAFVASFALVFDGLSDLLDFSDVGVEASIMLGLSLLTQGLNFPDTEIGNPDGYQLLIYALNWVPASFSALLFASKKLNPALKDKASKATPFVNLFFGAIQLVTCSWAGVLDPAFAGKDDLGMISGICSSIPYLAKFGATGEALSPERIAVSVIDGVFEATSLGLSVASW